LVRATPRLDQRAMAMGRLIQGVALQRFLHHLAPLRVPRVPHALLAGVAAQPGDGVVGGRGRRRSLARGGELDGQERLHLLRQLVDAHLAR